MLFHYFISIVSIRLIRGSWKLYPMLEIIIKLHVDVSWLLFFIKISYIWLVRTKCLGEINEQTPQRHMFNKDWITSSIFTHCSKFNGEHNSTKETNPHALLVSITMSWEVQISIGFLLMFHHLNYANATYIWRRNLCSKEDVEHESELNDSNLR